jgi:hypothetical protein
MDSVYVIQLEHGKFFLLNTTSRRFDQTDIDFYLSDSSTHDETLALFKTLDIPWLQIHRPVFVYAKYSGGPEDLAEYLIEFIIRYGIDHVRAIHPTKNTASIELDNFTKMAIRADICRKKNLCIYCMERSHVVEKCTIPYKGGVEAYMMHR